MHTRLRDVWQAGDALEPCLVVCLVVCGAPSGRAFSSCGWTARTATAPAMMLARGVEDGRGRMGGFC